jgi:hypothetical protein
VNSYEWNYSCPFAPSEEEAARIRKSIDENRLVSGNAKGGPPSNKDTQASPRLHPEAVQLIRSIEAAIKDKTFAPDPYGDHSNTQFAALALWIARKHGVACNNAIALAEKHFRSVQERDGGWNYNARDPNDPASRTGSTPPMTCSGLVGIAAGRGVGLHALKTKSNAPVKSIETADAANDRAAQAALKYLEKAIKQSDLAKPVPEASEEGGNLRDNLYFLWSLERVAMIYDLEKIGSLDWYKWGSEHLIKTQNKDGSWGQKGYHGANEEINTAFALLFLNRANLAKDLTATLKGTGTAKIKLPDRKSPEAAKSELKSTPPVATDFDAEANRLCNSLVSATASSRAGILTQLRDNKGSVYTDALVRAIAKLQGEKQREAREVLALRLKRMTAVTLREMLKDENREIRSAAASACALKEDKQLIPDLIAALGDSDSLVVQSAHTSLRGLSGKDFGPASDASAADKARAAADWKAWWMSQPK